ncbi:MAG: hypothetical protein AB1585_05995 [Thermodesulfobacteriota bacterium]
MNDKIESKNQIEKNKQIRFDEAKKSFQKLQEEIAPYIKKREFKEVSTAGEWCETSSLHS